MLKDYWKFVAAFWLVYSLLVGLIFWISEDSLMGGLTYGLSNWIGAFYVFFVFSAMNRKFYEIPTIQVSKLPRSQLDWLFLGMVSVIFLPVGLIVGLLFRLISMFVGWEDELGVWLIGGLAVGLASGMALGLRLTDWMALDQKNPDTQPTQSAHPQERLAEAVRSSFILIPLLTIAAMLFFVLVQFRAEQANWVSGTVFSMKVFYIVLGSTLIACFFFLGTGTVLKHYLLRLCLRWEGQLPLRLVPWLEAMQQRKVLQRVGGSYHFLHKQLQEYLAKSKVA